MEKFTKSHCLTQCWGFWTRNKSELHRINTNIKPYLQFSTEQKLSFKLKPRASQERSEAIIILHHIIKLQKNASQKVIWGKVSLKLANLLSCPWTVNNGMAGGYLPEPEIYPILVVTSDLKLLYIISTQYMWTWHPWPAFDIVKYLIFLTPNITNW